METKRKKAGIVCCSNGQRLNYVEKIRTLEETLRIIGIEAVFSPYIYERENVYSATAIERAKALMDFYQNDEITEIFDISGGDIANGILPYLDYSVIANCTKRFWGYSDLTTIINAIYAKTKKVSVLYQVRNLIYDHCRQQCADFQNTLIDQGTALFQWEYIFVQGQLMEGCVVGGNIRCFLKLAGTEYMPDLQDKILLLEAYSGTVAQMETYLCQLQQLGAFQKIAGILLGTFTQMEAEACQPTMEMLVKKLAGKHLPIAVTHKIGHGTDAKAIVIGAHLRLEKNNECGGGCCNKL